MRVVVMVVVAVVVKVIIISFLLLLSLHVAGWRRKGSTVAFCVSIPHLMTIVTMRWWRRRSVIR